jgi:hypothetical protein
MRVLSVVIIFAGTAFALDAARAFPDGAPWGAANPAAEQNCATCHFGDDPVRESEALIIVGLPGQPEPGAIYELEINFEDPATVTSGFQLIAMAAEQQAGTFISSAAGVEFIGASIRSTEPIKSDGRVSWAVEWHAPAVIAPPIIFYVAASAANDDGSPFGDTIHFRTYKIATKSMSLSQD